MGNNQSQIQNQQFIESFNSLDWKRQSDKGLYQLWKNIKTGDRAEAYKLQNMPSDKDLQHYRFRNMQHKYLVGVLYVNIQQKKTLCNSGVAYVLTEYIPLDLGDLFSLNINEGMMILRASYSAFNTMGAFYSPFIPNKQLIGFNIEGKPKIWLNKNHSKNAAEKLIKAQIWQKHQGQISQNVRKILQMVQDKLIGKHFPYNFRQIFYQSNMNFFEAGNCVELTEGRKSSQVFATVDTFGSDNNRQTGPLPNNEMSRKNTFSTVQDVQRPFLMHSNSNYSSYHTMHRVQTMPSMISAPSNDQFIPMTFNRVNSPQPQHYMSSNKVQRSNSYNPQYINNNNATTPLHVGGNQKFVSPGKITQFKQPIFRKDQSQDQVSFNNNDNKESSNLAVQQKDSDGGEYKRKKSIHQKIFSLYDQQSAKKQIDNYQNVKQTDQVKDDQLKQYINVDSEKMLMNYHQQQESLKSSQPDWELNNNNSPAKQTEMQRQQQQFYQQELNAEEQNFHAQMEYDSQHSNSHQIEIKQVNRNLFVDEEEVNLSPNPNQSPKRSENKQNGYQQYKKIMQYAYQHNGLQQRQIQGTNIQNYGQYSYDEEQKVNSDHAIDINNKAQLESQRQRYYQEQEINIDKLQASEEQQQHSYKDPSIAQHQSSNYFSSQYNGQLNSQNHSRNPSKIDRAHQQESSNPNSQALSSDRHRHKSSKNNSTVKGQSSSGTLVIHESKQNIYTNIRAQQQGIGSQVPEQIQQQNQNRFSHETESQSPSNIKHNQEPSLNKVDQNEDEDYINQSSRNQVFHIRNQSNELFKYTSIDSVYQPMQPRPSQVQEIVKLQRHDDIEEYIRKKYSDLINPSSKSIESPPQSYVRQPKRQNGDRRTMTFAKPAQHNIFQNFRRNQHQEQRQDDREQLVYQNVQSKYQTYISNSVVRQSQPGMSALGSNNQRMYDNEQMNINEAEPSNSEEQDFLDVKNLQKSLDQRYSITDIQDGQKPNSQLITIEEDGFNVASLEQKLQKFQQSRQSQVNQTGNRDSNNNENVSFQQSDNIIELMERKIMQSQTIKKQNDLKVSQQYRQVRKQLQDVQLMDSITNPHQQLQGIPRLMADKMSNSNYNQSSPQSKRQQKYRNYGMDSEDFATGRQTKPFNAVSDINSDHHKRSRLNKKDSLYSQLSNHNNNYLLKDEFSTVMQEKYTSGRFQNHYQLGSKYAGESAYIDDNPRSYVSNQSASYRKRQRRSQKNIQAQRLADQISNKYDKYMGRNSRNLEQNKPSIPNSYQNRNYTNEGPNNIKDQYSYINRISGQQSYTNKSDLGQRKIHRKTSSYLNTITELNAEAIQSPYKKQSGRIQRQRISQQQQNDNLFLNRDITYTGSNRSLADQIGTGRLSNKSAKISYDDLRDLLRS